MEGANITFLIVGALIGALVLGGAFAFAKGACCSVKSGCCSTDKASPQK